MDDDALLQVIRDAAQRGEPGAQDWLDGKISIGITQHAVHFIFHDNQEGRTSPQANAWRTTIFQRDHYRCTDCGAKGRLHAHHVLPWANHPTRRFDTTNGITLCINCHAQRHPKHAHLIRKAKYHAT